MGRLFVACFPSNPPLVNRYNTAFSNLEMLELHQVELI
jgi:hypothetical protein